MLLLVGHIEGCAYVQELGFNSTGSVQDHVIIEAKDRNVRRIEFPQAFAN